MVIDRSMGGFRIGGVFELIIPLLTITISVIVSLLPYGALWSVSLAPLLGLNAIFFWSLYRPGLMPPLLVFIIGLYHDLLTTGPLGLWALTYVIFSGYFVEQRSFFVGKTSSELWIAFLMGLVISLIAVWGISCLYYFEMLSPIPILVQGMMTLLFYPVWTRVLMFFHRMGSSHLL